MTSSDRFPPKRVVLWLPPGGQLIALIGVMEAFDAANQLRSQRGKPPLYRIQVAGAANSTRSAAGLSVQTLSTADGPVHTLIVAGSLDDVGMADPEALASLRAWADRSERIVSVCAGTFWLGALGLLDGRRCTTHWLALEALRARFPAAKVQEDALFTEDDGVWTSAGATAGIDLALHLLRHDAGPSLARMVARLLVVFAHRPGGQSQFSAVSATRPATDDRLRAVMHRIVAQPGGDHRVPRLAKQSGMSERTFARRFKAQTGETPAAFVQRVRVEAAQRMLLDGDEGVDAIAGRCGFGTEATLRRAFRRVVGVSPGAWRARFA